MDKNFDMDYELIARALFESYETIYDINLETNKYRSFHESAEYKKLELDKDGDDFFESLSRKVAEIIAPDDREYVLRMLKKENLKRGLDTEKYYSFIYRIMQGDKEVYHQIRATYQPMEDGLHVFMGIKNIDSLARQEKKHQQEILAMQQKESNHLRAVLASAAAYMEVNLSKDLVIEKSDDNPRVEERFVKNIPSIDYLPKYSDMHNWICSNLITENREKYERVGSRDYLLDCYEQGEFRCSIFFSVFTKEGGTQPCREVFFLYKEDLSNDICAFCVIYDLTEHQKAERERDKLEQELRLSRIRNFTSQMQPHFLYNALGSIQEVMLLNPELASDLLGDFTIHLRSCIRAMTRDDLIPFSKELENIKAYINIEKMRFGDKLNAHYDIKCTRFSVLPLTVQPIVENAIRHGVYGRGIEGGSVYIKSYETKRTWVIEVKDDGIGFNTNAYNRRQKLESNESTGLENIKFRLEKIMNASIDVKSEVGKGTAIKIRIPKEVKEDESHYS